MKSARCSILAATLLATAALFTACHSTQANDPVLRTWEHNRWSELFKLIDSDHDGKVTPEEFQRNYAAVTWLYFDKNGDGFITMQEWAIDGTGRARQRWFLTLDENGDGVISKREFEQAMTPEGTAEFFAIMDVDGNGFITIEDIERTQ